MTAPVCFVDTETLGLHPDRHAIWEIALIVDERSHVWHLDLTADELAAADPFALEMTSYGTAPAFADSWHGRAVPPATAIAEFIDLVDDRHLVGAVVSFDEERLRRLAARHGEEHRWHYHLVDCEGLVAGLLGVEPPWDSEELSRAVGVEPSSFGRHTALGDGLWAKALYEAVMSWPR